MRNLKRVLSLTLASVMLLGMMVIGSSAAEAKKIDFTDADEIEYTEAVDVMVALGILEGNPNGNFNPKGTLTREAAAKIICYMLLGEDNAEKLTANKDVFTDVAADRWSAGYISYCVERNILAGTGNGNFNPAGELTGVAFGKMLLVALGYDPAVQGYTGSSWALSVAADMVDAGIAPAGVLLSAPLTREQAAQTAFQTMTADVVRYTQKPVTVTNADGSTVVVGAGEVVAVSNDPDDDYRRNGALAADDADDKQQFCEKYFPDLTKISDNDDFQRPGGTWKVKSADVVFAADEPTARYTSRFTYKELVNAMGNSLVKDLGDVSYYLDGDPATGLYHNNGSAAADYDMESNLYTDRTKTNSHLGDRGLLTEVYVHDDDTVTVVMVNTYLAQVEGDYDADDEELELTMLGNAAPNDNTLKLDEFPTIPNYSDEDYVLITIASDEIKTIVPAEDLTGSVDKYTKSSTVTIDGETYNYSKEFYNTVAGNSAVTMTYDVGEDARVIMDAYGFIIGLADVESSDSYVYIKDFDSNGNFSKTFIADAYFADGTDAIITLDKIDGKGFVSATPDDGRGTPGSITLKDGAGNKGPGWYTFTEKDGKYKLTSVTNQGGTAFTYASVAAADKEIISAGRVQVYYADTSYLRANNSTVFVVNDDGDITVTTGVKNAPTVTVLDNTPTVKVWAVQDGTSYTSYVYVELGNASFDGATTDSGDIIFILDAAGYDVSEDSNDEFYTYDAIVNGKKTTIDANDTSIFPANGLYYKVKYDSSDFVDDAKPVADGTDDYVVKSLDDVTVTQKNKTVIFGSVVDLYLADDAFIRLIDGTDVTNMTASTLANRYKNGGLSGCVWASTKDDETTGVYVALTVVDSEEESIAAANITVSGSATNETIDWRSETNADTSGLNGKTLSVTATGKTRAANSVTFTVTFTTASVDAGDNTKVQVYSGTTTNYKALLAAAVTKLQAQADAYTAARIAANDSYISVKSIAIPATNVTSSSDWTVTATAKEVTVKVDGVDQPFVAPEEEEEVHTCSASTLTSKSAVAGADCQTKGTGAYYLCSCGKMYSDANAENEIQEIPEGEVGAHSYGAWAISSDSSSHERSCETSGCTDKETHTVPTQASDKVAGCTECDKLTLS